MALLIHEALLERAASGALVSHPAVAAIIAATILGEIDECIQLLIPSRVFDPVDLLFNALAATVAVGSVTAIQRARRGRP